MQDILTGVFVCDGFFSLILGYFSTCQLPLRSLENGMSYRGITSLTYNNMLLNQIITTRPRRESRLRGV